MALEVTTQNGTTVVRFTEKCLRGPELQETGDQLFRLVAEVGPGTFRLDFGRVGYVTSLALGKLLALRKQVQTAGGRLILANLNCRVYEVFDITRLTRLFDIRRQGHGKATPSQLTLASYGVGSVCGWPA